MDPDIPLATAQTWRSTWLWVAAQVTPICMALGQYDPQAPTWPQLPAQTPGHLQSLEPWTSTQTLATVEPQTQPWPSTADQTWTKPLLWVATQPTQIGTAPVVP